MVCSGCGTTLGHPWAAAHRVGDAMRIHDLGVRFRCVVLLSDPLRGLIVTCHRLTAALLLSIVVISTAFVPVASAQDTGRIERCAVQSADFGTVLVAYTLDDQGAVQVAAGQ